VAVILVAYDISDDGKRQKLANELLRMGFTRVQRSVYIARTGYRGLRERAARAAARRIDPETDSVLILTVPEWSLESAIRIGLQEGGEGVRAY